MSGVCVCVIRVLTIRLFICVAGRRRSTLRVVLLVRFSDVCVCDVGWAEARYSGYCCPGCVFIGCRMVGQVVVATNGVLSLSLSSTSPPSSASHCLLFLSLFFAFFCLSLLVGCIVACVGVGAVLLCRIVMVLLCLLNSTAASERVGGEPSFVCVFVVVVWRMAGTVVEI